MIIARKIEVADNIELGAYTILANKHHPKRLVNNKHRWKTTRRRHDGREIVMELKQEYCFDGMTISLRRVKIVDPLEDKWQIHIHHGQVSSVIARPYSERYGKLRGERERIDANTLDNVHYNYITSYDIDAFQFVVLASGGRRYLRELQSFKHHDRAKWLQRIYRMGLIQIDFQSEFYYYYDADRVASHAQGISKWLKENITWQ